MPPIEEVAPATPYNPLPSQSHPLWVSLTARERDVATLLARGETCREIAKALGISVKTVDTHRMHVLKKMQLSNTVKLSIWLTRAGVTVWS